MTPEELANARALLPVPIGSGQTIKASGDAAVRRRKVVEMFPELIAHIDAQAAQIKQLEEDSDCTDIITALEDAGIPMGDAEQPQDIITAIGLLGGQISALKDALVEAAARQAAGVTFGDKDNC